MVAIVVTLKYSIPNVAIREQEGIFHGAGSANAEPSQLSGIEVYKLISEPLSDFHRCEGLRIAYMAELTLEQGFGSLIEQAAFP